MERIVPAAGLTREYEVKEVILDADDYDLKAEHGCIGINSVSFLISIKAGVSAIEALEYLLGLNIWQFFVGENHDLEAMLENLKLIQDSKNQAELKQKVEDWEHILDYLFRYYMFEVSKSRRI